MSEEIIQDKSPKTAKPKVYGKAQEEIDRVEKQFNQFEDEIKEMTFDQLNFAKKEETERQTQLSSKELHKAKEIYLKPKRALSSKEIFNEKFRKDWEFMKEYVHFIAENREVIGEGIEIWTKPFPGVPCEEWSVPVNKPIWGPRYLAEQIKRKYYHRMKMDESKIRGAEGNVTYYGQMTVETTVPRLEAYPVDSRRSIFNGASSF